MSVIIESTRFGRLEVPAEAVIEFPAGLIGLGGSRYALLTRDPDTAFVWLHSVDDPSLAMPVTNPWYFFRSFEVILSDADAERMQISAADEAEVYVTVRAAEALEDFAANLRAPILVVGGRGFQVINEAEHAPLCAPLFAEIATETIEGAPTAA